MLPGCRLCSADVLPSSYSGQSTGFGIREYRAPLAQCGWISRWTHLGELRRTKGLCNVAPCDMSAEPLSTVRCLSREGVTRRPQARRKTRLAPEPKSSGKCIWRVFGNQGVSLPFLSTVEVPVLQGLATGSAPDHSQANSIIIIIIITTKTNIINIVRIRVSLQTPPPPRRLPLAEAALDAGGVAVRHRHLQGGMGLLVRHVRLHRLELDSDKLSPIISTAVTAAQPPNEKATTKQETRRVKFQIRLPETHGQHHHNHHESQRHQTHQHHRNPNASDRGL